MKFQKNSILFIFAIFSYFLLQMLSRILISDSLQTDEAEQLLLSQLSLQWGYNAEPPLYTWLQILFFSLIPNKIMGLAALKNALLFTSLLGIFFIAQTILHNSSKAILATCSLIFIPAISFEAQRDLSHSVLLLCLSVFTFLIILKIIKNQNPGILYYVLLGVAIGLGGISKYTYIIFILSLFVTSILLHEIRDKVYNSKLLFTIAIAFLITIGHALWLYLYLPQISFDNKINQFQHYHIIQSFSGVYRVIQAALFFSLPFLAVYFCLFGKSFCNQKQNNLTENQKLTFRFITTFYIVAIVLFICIVLFLNMTKFKQRWFIPFLFSVPIYSFLWLELYSNTWLDKSKEYFTLIITTALLIYVALFGRILIVDYTHRYNKLNHSYIELADEMLQKNFQPTIIIGEDQLIAGNLKLLFPQANSICPRVNIPITLEQKILIVWDSQNPKHFIDFVQKVLPGFVYDSGKVKTVFTKYKYSNAKCELYYLYLDGF